MAKRSMTGFEFLFFVLLLPCIGILSAMGKALVMRCLWDWFAVPIGLPHVRLTAWMGLAGIVTLLIVVPSKTDNDESPWYAMLHTVIFNAAISLLVLLQGWIVYKIAVQ